MDHAETVWYYAMHIGEIFYTPLLFVPLLSGIVFAVAQFLPETRNERFRICLHLPVTPYFVIAAHVGSGLVALLLVFALDAFFLGVMTSSKFPIEFVQRSLLSFMPWLLAGINAYLGAALVLLEPSWRGRIFNLIVSCGFVGLFLLKAEAGGYANVLLSLVILSVLFGFCILIPTFNFRYRRV